MTDEEVKKSPGDALAYPADKLTPEQLTYCVRELPGQLSYCKEATKQNNNCTIF